VPPTLFSTGFTFLFEHPLQIVNPVAQLLYQLPLSAYGLSRVVRTFVLYCLVLVQYYPDTAGFVLLMCYLSSLDALSDSINGKPKMAGSLIYGYTVSGLTLWTILSHTGDTRPLGQKPQAGIRHPRCGSGLGEVPPSGIR
jgi:hypothetical protein